MASTFTPGADPGTWEDVTFTATATVPCGTVDLAVSRVGTRVERSQSQCTVLNWRFVVKNVGSSSAVGATARVQVVDDGLTTQDVVLQLPPLGTNQSILMEGSIDTFAGVATVAVTADPDGSFNECNETNNMRSKSVTCNG
jgi:subtilase family serine protease